MGYILGIANPEGEENDHDGEELTKQELEDQWNSIVGLPMFDDHDYKRPVGNIAGASLVDGKLLIIGKVNEDTTYGKDAYEKIKSGKYGGLSLGTFGKQCNTTNKISDRMIAEASICPGKEGKRPGTSILLTLNSGTEREQKITMDMQPIMGASPLMSEDGSPFNVPIGMIQGIYKKAQEFIENQARVAGILDPSPSFPGLPDPSHPQGKSSMCDSCHRPMTERKTNTEISGKKDVEMKEAEKSTILSQNVDNVKKTDSASSTSTTEGRINTEANCEHGKQRSSTHTSPMEKTVYSEDLQIPQQGYPTGSGGSEPRKDVDESYSNDQLNLEGAVDAPVVGGPSQSYPPSGGSMPPPPTTGTHPGGVQTPTYTPTPTPQRQMREPQSYYQTPSQTPFENNGKRKADEQPRNKKGQWMKKPRQDGQEGSSHSPSEGGGEEEGKRGYTPDSSDINGLLNKLQSTKKSGEDSVNLSMNELQEIIARAKGAEQLQKERDEAMKREEELKKSFEAQRRSLEKESKHSKVNSIINNTTQYLELAKAMVEKDPENKSLWQSEIEEKNEWIKDPDTLYEKGSTELDDMNKRTLVLTRCSNTFKKDIVNINATHQNEMKKYENLLGKKADTAFDQSSRRRRGPPEVQPQSGGHRGPLRKFENLMTDVKDTESSSSSSSQTPSNGNLGRSGTTTSQRSGNTSSGSSWSEIPTFFGDSAAPSHIVPFKYNAVCAEGDPNSNIFKKIENDLRGGGFFGYTNVDTPGIVGKDWYDKPYRLPGIDSVGRGVMQLPAPAWKATQSVFY